MPERRHNQGLLSFQQTEQFDSALPGALRMFHYLIQLSWMSTTSWTSNPCLRHGGENRSTVPTHIT